LLDVHQWIPAKVTATRCASARPAHGNLPAGGYDKRALQSCIAQSNTSDPFVPAISCFAAAALPSRLCGARRHGQTATIDEEGHESWFPSARRNDRPQRDPSARYPCDPIALNTVYLCRFSFRRCPPATRMPGIQQRLFVCSARISARPPCSLATAPTNAWPHSDPVCRSPCRARFSTRFRLSMSRGDIANYLRLAPETVSRILRRFAMMA
jgi:CRP/FNR family transcriptional regulator